MTPVRASVHAAFVFSAACVATSAPVRNAEAADGGMFVGEPAFWLAVAVVLVSIMIAFYGYRRARAAEALAGPSQARAARRVVA